MVLENFNARPPLSKPPPSPPTLGRGNCHSEPGRSRNTFAERSRNTFQNGQQILFITWVRKYFSEMLRNGIYIRLFKNPVTANQSAVCSARIQRVPTIPFHFISTASGALGVVPFSDILYIIPGDRFECS